MSTVAGATALTSTLCAAEFDRHHLGERNDGRLGCGIGAAVDLVADARDRGEKYDTCEFALRTGDFEKRHGFPGAEPEPAHVDGEELVEVFHGHGVERTDPQQSGRTDETVQAAKAPADVAERAGDAFGGSDVADLSVQPVAGRGKLLAQGFQASLVAIEGDDRPTFREQALGRAAPDA